MLLNDHLIKTVTQLTAANEVDAVGSTITGLLAASVCSTICETDCSGRPHLAQVTLLFSMLQLLQ